MPYTSIETIHAVDLFGKRYPIVDGHSHVHPKNGQLRCPNCQRHNKGKYQGELSQAGMYRDTVIEVFHCVRCGHDYAFRWIYDHTLEESKGYGIS